ncbi:hypothetical protein Droror1_Dr00007600 [Drosera rotundifolia]
MVRITTLRKADDSAVSQSLSQFGLSSSSKPSWLLSYLADLEEKMKVLVQNAHEDEEADTFAQRAESYYRKRPQLLSLLQDLYNAYVSLAHSYSQSVSKHHQLLADDEGECYHDPAGIGDGRADSDAESAISYQQQSSSGINLESALSDYNVDGIIAELVIKSVEYDLMEHELNVRERRFLETSRKVELQKSLLEVLESERMILLNENTRLEYKVASLVEENKGLASETIFMKRKAGELARCVLKMRDDHRVFMLSRKIEDLQGQIFSLEKRNKEYYNQLVKKREQNKCCSCEAYGIGDGERKDAHCAGGGRAAGTPLGGGRGGAGGTSGSVGVKVMKWWDSVKSLDFFLCAPKLKTDGP